VDVGGFASETNVYKVVEAVKRFLRIQADNREFGFTCHPLPIA